MSALGKLMGAISVGKAISSSVPMLQQLATDIAILACYGVMIAVLGSAFVLGMAGVIYVALTTHYGMSMQAAAGSVGGGLLLLIALLVAATLQRVRRLASLHAARHEPHSAGGITSQLAGAADAFFEGLMTHKVKRPAKKDTAQKDNAPVE